MGNNSLMPRGTPTPPRCPATPAQQPLRHHTLVFPAAFGFQEPSSRSSWAVSWGRGPGDGRSHPGPGSTPARSSIPAAGPPGLATPRVHPAIRSVVCAAACRLEQARSLQLCSQSTCLHRPLGYKVSVQDYFFQPSSALISNSICSIEWLSS